MPTRYVTINGQRVPDPRSTAAWQRLVARVIRDEPTCWLNLPGVCTVTSTTGDHILTVTARPDLALTRSNVRGACRPCNEARGSLPVEALNLRTQPAALDIFDGPTPKTSSHPLAGVEQARPLPIPGVFPTPTASSGACGTRACTKCGQVKPLEDFYLNPRGAGGRRRDCKGCVLEERRVRYAVDGDLLRARSRGSARGVWGGEAVS